MKKCLFATIVLVVFLASGCGSKSLSESALKEELPDEIFSVYIDGTEQVLALKSFEVEKRQIKDGQDLAYCCVSLSDEFYSFKKYVLLDNSYYDKGGWLLDKWSEYQEADYSVLDNPLSEDNVFTEVLSQYLKNPK